jgi:hypothetical protein
VNRYHSAVPSSESPSGYTIAVAKPLLATETERSLFSSFLHACPNGRSAVAAQALDPNSVVELTQNQRTEVPGARASSPIVLSDKNDDEDDEELEYCEPFNSAHHPTEYLEFFGHKDEDLKPDPATLNSKDRIEVHDETDDDDAMSVEDVLPSTGIMGVNEDGHQFDLDEFGDENVIGRDMLMSGNVEIDDEHETAYRSWRDRAIDLIHDSDESKIKEEVVDEALPAPALAPATSNHVHVNIDNRKVAAPEDGPEALHERRLDRSIDRELERTAHKANTRPTNPLEEILAKDHSMLYFYHHKIRDAVVRHSIEFIRGLRAEHSILNSECQHHEMQLRAMRRMTNRDIGRLIWKVDNQYRLAAGLGSHLLLVETEFRALVAREDLDMKVALKTAMDGVKEAVQDYDKQVAALDRE